MNVDPAYYYADHRSVLKSDSHMDNAKSGGQTSDDNVEDPTLHPTA
jgi:hypothetical protein